MNKKNGVCVFCECLNERFIDLVYCELYYESCEGICFIVSYYKIFKYIFIYVSLILF